MREGVLLIGNRNYSQFVNKFQFIINDHLRLWWWWWWFCLVPITRHDSRWNLSQSPLQLPLRLLLRVYSSILYTIRWCGDYLRLAGVLLVSSRVNILLSNWYGSVCGLVGMERAIDGRQTDTLKLFGWNGCHAIWAVEVVLCFYYILFPDWPIIL